MGANSSSIRAHNAVAYECMGSLKSLSSLSGTKNVYMLDLMAGQRQWEKCASMHYPRLNFGSGVIDGKIYICGGSSSRAPVFLTAVNDTKIDAWTIVKPMPFGGIGHEVGIVEDEVWVYRASTFDPNYLLLQAAWRQSQPWRRLNTGRPTLLEEANYTHPADFVEVYNPIENKWRRLPEERVHAPSGRLFVAKGRLHSMTQ